MKNKYEQLEINYFQKDGKDYLSLATTMEVDMNSQRDKIRLLLDVTGYKQTEVCEAIGWQPSQLMSKYNHNKLRFHELRKIAKAVGCEMDIRMVFDDGTSVTGVDSHELVLNALSHVQMMQSVVATRLGMSRQSFSQKIIRGCLSYNDLKEIAEAIGCKYEFFFVLPNGCKI